MKSGDKSPHSKGAKIAAGLPAATPKPATTAAVGEITDLAQLPPVPVQPGQPLIKVSLVSRPKPIPGLRSWSIESRGTRGDIVTIAAGPDSKHVARQYSTSLRVSSTWTGRPTGPCCWPPLAAGRLAYSSHETASWSLLFRLVDFLE
ncbi:MAG: hypothetical protein NTY19_28790 [Planctomycetota bacterium]|nr:hypothetical protein [Planctomycetota bacterium]